MDQMQELMEEQEDELEVQDSETRQSQHLNLNATRSLLKEMSGSFDNLANNPVTETTLRIIDAYDYSSSEDEYDFEIESESDEEEEIEAMDGLKSARRKLVDVSESTLYTKGSLKRIEVEIMEEIESLKAAHSAASSTSGSSNALPGMKAFPGLRRQKTFAGTQNLGIELPESNATTEDVSEWVKANCYKLPNCPDLENEKVLSALVWATRALGHLHEHHS